MNRESKRADLKQVEVEGVETVDLVIRNIDGKGVLFTSDGKLINHQVSGMGFYYYIGEDDDREQTFRATFITSTMESDKP